MAAGPDRRLPLAIPRNDAEVAAARAAGAAEVVSAEEAATIWADLRLMLEAEVSDDPERRGYAGRTPAQVAELLNSEHRVVRRVPGPLVLLGAPQFSSLDAALADAEWGPTVQHELHENHATYGRWLGQPERVLEMLEEPREILVQLLPPRWPRLVQGMSHVPSSIGAGDVADLLGVSGG